MTAGSVKKIHFIGICGVAMSAIAIAFKKAGYIVSGSDVGFFPPVSDALETEGISFYPGWHPDKMIEEGLPDVVVVGNVASSSNPEWLYAQKNKIPYKSYPEIISEFFIKSLSIVCAGTYGKTTTSALLSWILAQAGKKPNYMFGGLAIGGFDSASICEGCISVIEGDEYKSARWDNSPKFSHYSPTHLLLTSVIWDHADVYPEEASYVEAFRSLIAKVPKDGLVVACDDNENVKHLTALPLERLITYGRSNSANYRYTDIKQTKNGLSFSIIHNGEIYIIQRQLLGEYQAENITGAFAMASEIGISRQEICKHIQTFPGLKRRLEKRYEGYVTVFDDIAHSPTKAKSALATLRKIYGKKIFVVFEPNTGNRKKISFPQYDNAFKDADCVIIPQLTKIKKDPYDSEMPMDAKTLELTIAKTHKNALSFEDDEALVNFLAKKANPGDVVAFLGSHGFRGMIDELVISLRQQSPR